MNTSEISQRKMKIRWSNVFTFCVIAIAVILVPGCKKSLHEAVRSSGIGTIQELIADGADVNARNDDGNTPLHVAATSGRVDAAALLVDSGAKIDSKNGYGYTPLQVADFERCGHPRDWPRQNQSFALSRRRRRSRPCAVAYREGCGC